MCKVYKFTIFKIKLMYIYTCVINTASIHWKEDVKLYEVRIDRCLYLVNTEYGRLCSHEIVSRIHIEYTGVVTFVLKMY